MKRPSRRPGVIIRRRVTAVGVTLAVAAVAVTAWVGAVRQPTVEIGGAPVTTEDMSYYRGLADDGVFRADDDDALLDRIATDRALFRLAERAHLTDGYSSMRQVLDQRGAVNRTRATASAAGDLVYGDTAYDDASFYGRVVAQLRTATERALADGDDPRLAVTDAQVRAAFAAHPDRWTAAATTYDCTTLTTGTGTGTGTSATGDAALQRVADAGADLEQAADTMPGARLATRTIAAADIRTSGLDPDAQAALPGLAPGDTLPPQTDHGDWVLYRLDATSVDRREALRTYRSAIRQQLLDERFDHLLTTMRADLRHPTS